VATILVVRGIHADRPVRRSLAQGETVQLRLLESHTLLCLLDFEKKADYLRAAMKVPAAGSVFGNRVS
jgi:hypothetical protein